MRIQQGRIELELRQLADGEGTAALLLHQLYGSSADWAGDAIPWRGPVYALDLAGHGRSGWNKGGAYTPELLACGADEALKQLGEAALVGRGVGAYIALLLAGARPEVIPGALLLPGRGLEGGGSVPHFAEPRNLVDSATPRQDSDPLLNFLEVDVRPIDYVEPFAHRAQELVLLEDDTPRPPWWNAVRAFPGVHVVRDLAAGLALL